jgi:transcription initiation factor IIE alpha subunit
MHRERAEDLTDFLKERVGEYLRGVGFYDADEYEVLYVRQDLRRESLKEDIDRMMDRLRQETRPKENRAFPFGELDGTVRSFEEAVVMHFPLPQEHGAVVTLDPEAARQLNDFMRECVQRL